jgi:hypothetical protein
MVWIAVNTFTRFVLHDIPSSAAGTTVSRTSGKAKELTVHYFLFANDFREEDRSTNPIQFATTDIEELNKTSKT